MNHHTCSLSAHHQLSRKSKHHNFIEKSTVELPQPRGHLTGPTKKTPVQTLSSLPAHSIIKSRWVHPWTGRRRYWSLKDYHALRTRRLERDKQMPRWREGGQPLSAAANLISNTGKIATYERTFPYILARLLSPAARPSAVPGRALPESSPSSSTPAPGANTAELSPC